MRYKKLLSPICIGNQIIKNRLTYPNASPHFLQGPETYPAEGYRAFAANLAKNGAAIVNFAEWANYPKQRSGPVDVDFTHMQAFDMTDPAVHNYISQMCEEVHFYGSKIILTTEFAFPEGLGLYDSPGNGPYPKPTKAVPLEQLPEMVERTVNKLRLYRNLGFDGASFRCDKFMRNTEHRDDIYSGETVEGRTRLFHDLCVELKKQLGKNFIIEGVLHWSQVNGYGDNFVLGSGYTENDAMEFLRLFDDVIDIVEVRESDGCRAHPTGYNMKEYDHPAVEFCGKAKAAGIKTVLKPIGGFQDPDEMERILASGKCDMFGVARGLMADNSYRDKLYQGRGEDVVPCIKCNKCHGVILPDADPWVSVCSVNPVQGIGHKLHRLVEPASTSKKVAVIGGGPAGMRAAIYAAQRGHDVTLYEKTGTLGGQLFHSDHFSFKWPIKNYKNWLIYTLGKAGVKVIMNTEPTPQMILADGYDAVLAATGAAINIPNIPGLKDNDGNAKYLSCLEVLGKEDTLGKHIIMIGGSEVGIETAMHLCENGHNVTILTRQKELAHNASKLHYITMSVVLPGPNGLSKESPAWEVYHNLKGITCAETICVEGNTVTYVQDGEEKTITGDSVVVCGGMTPRIQEAMAYTNLSTEFYAIGDCNGAGNLEVCNREAYSRAMIL